MEARATLDRERAVRLLMQSVPATVLGARVRRERLAQGVSIRDLAENAQVGKSSIVRLEAGEEFRPITLVKVCEALGLHVERLAQSGEAGSVAVHRAEDDRWFQLADFGAGPLGGFDRALTEDERRRLVAEGARNPLLLLRSRLDQSRLLPTVIEVYEPSELRSHPGEEFVYVLRGPVRVIVDGTVYELETGESIDFWGTEMHGYAPGAGGEPGVILSVRVNP